MLSLSFTPLLPWPAIAVLGVLVAILAVFARPGPGPDRAPAASSSSPWFWRRSPTRRWCGRTASP